MKILLDECLPKKLGRFLKDHDVKTVQQAGWSGVKNGKLLQQAQSEFDIFITIDQNLVAQQNISNFKLGILVLTAYSSDIEDLIDLVPEISAILQKGNFTGVKRVGT